MGISSWIEDGETPSDQDFGILWSIFIYLAIKIHISCDQDSYILRSRFKYLAIKIHISCDQWKRSISPFFIFERSTAQYFCVTITINDQVPFSHRHHYMHNVDLSNSQQRNDASINVYQADWSNLRPSHWCHSRCFAFIGLRKSQVLLSFEKKNRKNIFVPRRQSICIAWTKMRCRLEYQISCTKNVFTCIKMPK